VFRPRNCGLLRKNQPVREIWGYRSGEYGESYLSGCLTVWLTNTSGLEELFPPSSGWLLWLWLRPWVRRRIFPPKCWYPPVSLNGVNPNRALKLFSSYITWSDVWFEFPERNYVVGFKIMNQMRPAGFNMYLVLRSHGIRRVVWVLVGIHALTQVSMFTSFTYRQQRPHR